MAKIVVSASSLPAGRNMSSQVEYIKRVQSFGADMYHIDVMDGKFVKRETIDFNYFEQLRENSILLFDVHLMVEEPSTALINKYIKNGSHIITLHLESFEDKGVLIKRLKYIKKKGCMAGLAFDIETPAEDVMAFLNYVDMVCVMAVKTGAGGQKFNEEALDKIKELRKTSKKLLIEVDGGINASVAKKCVKAGADILAVGSYIYDNDAYDAIQSLKDKD